MSTGLYKDASGLALGTGLYANVSGLSAGGGFSPSGGGSLQPWLILDFVGPSVSGQSLSLEFILAPSGTYSAFQPDTSQPQSGFTNIQVWN